MEIPFTFTARPDTGLYNGKLGIWLFLASEVMLFGAIFTAYLFVRLGADDGTWPNHVQNIWIGLTNTGILLFSSITMVYAWVALKERKFDTYRAWLAVTILCGIAFLCFKGKEYHDKYIHWGFFIKEAEFAKYQPDLDKINAFYSYIPAQGLYEVRGHWPDYTADAKSATIEPDAKPIYWNSPVKAGEKGAGEEEEPKITINLADVERHGRLLPAYGTYYAIYFLVTGLHALHIIGGVVVMLYFLILGSKLYKRNAEQLSNRMEVTGIFWHFVDLVWITVFPLLYLT